MSVKFKDNSGRLLEEFETKSGVALNLIGSQATRHVQELTPVRTGNLVNHADWEVSDDEKSVDVGFKTDFENPEDNPFYAKYVELGSPTNIPQHMLKRGITENTDEYKAILKRIFAGSSVDF